MNFLELVKERHSVRHYAQQVVEKEKLESDSCDGAERFCKAGSAGCACAGWHSMIR